MRDNLKKVNNDRVLCVKIHFNLIYVKLVRLFSKINFLYAFALIWDESKGLNNIDFKNNLLNSYFNIKLIDL
jgi:hypothetical protein